MATLDGARCHIQMDIGFGDAVTPEPQEVEYPTLLGDLKAPKLNAYPRYTVVAEKFEALASLGMANSRMKDYFDLWVLAHHSHFDGDTLSKAINATFARRQTPLPVGAPLGLTLEFSQDTQKQTQWRAFLRKNALAAPALEEVVDFLDSFLMPTTSKEGDCAYWQAGGPWKPQ